jgi:hypothetical protein
MKERGMDEYQRHEGEQRDDQSGCEFSLNEAENNLPIT